MKKFRHNDNQTSPNSRRLRTKRTAIMLNREDSIREFEISQRFHCYSLSRIVVSRILSLLKKRKSRKTEKVMMRECGRDSSTDDRPRIAADNVYGHQQQEQMTVNLAAGLSLLSLIVATKSELDKTVELRREMEVFLRRASEENDCSKSSIPKVSDEESIHAVSTTVDGFSNLSPFSQDDVVCVLEGCDDGINRLEKEFAAELERLQFDGEIDRFVESRDDVSGNLQEEITEISWNNNNATETIAIPQHCGVSPVELKRRLHELLEAQQEEKIKELEARLEYMKKKVKDKEEEVIWWKHTAKFISKQAPESLGDWCPEH